MMKLETRNPTLLREFQTRQENDRRQRFNAAARHHCEQIDRRIEKRRQSDNAAVLSWVDRFNYYRSI